ncbi:MAG: hypothetical protein A2Y62_09255 [Candidatus Fischerbacteria bacterium RBG_13_37_8]|uniref:Aerotolerance regulator N-terminal domain-containing protein n=1 Tax=Candidatus Fischerbacteria bacterium RBG_13_37_8 TaxID=1817863 RepID=A0A1F5VE97_9BACT|nr:MAG: hypothetical protein A2Y62_09255 [Candidatus Fischerbacteria bacterium RBG_13_37_8]
MLIVGQGLSIIYIPLLIVGIYLSIKYREGKILEVLSKRDVCISFAVNSKRGMPFNLMQIVAVVTLIFLMLFSICMKEGAHLSRCWLI